jgi:hypothetical protein
MADLTFVKVGVDLRNRIKELSDTELRVLVALGLRIDEERKCWPSIGSLESECSRSERMIRYAINGLIEKGFVFIGRRIGGRGHPTVYTLNGYFAYGTQRVQLVAPFKETLQSIAPFNDKKGAITDRERGQSPTQRGQPIAKKANANSLTEEEPIEEEGPVEEARTPDAGASGASPQTQDATKASPFKEALRAVSDAKNKPTTLFDIVRKKFPDYNWDARASPKSWIGRCGQLLKTFGIRKVLEAFWLTETQAREGDPVSYAQAILIAKGKIPGRGEATQHDFRKW